MARRELINNNILKQIKSDDRRYNSFGKQAFGDGGEDL